MKLYAKNYEKKEKEAKPSIDKSSIEVKIKALIPNKGSIDYEEVIKEIQKTDNLTNDFIVEICNKLREDGYNYVEEDVEDIQKVTK